MSSNKVGGIPPALQEFAEKYPEIWSQYEGLGDACHRAGPLDDKTRRLVKLAIAVGAQLEGGARGQVRKARSDGLDPADLEHVVALALPTLGLPGTIAAYTWVTKEWASGATA